MSVLDIANVLNYSKATGRAKLVLVGIANHANDDGQAWPGIATLARYANCSERSVKRDLQELVGLGELKIIKNGAPVGGQYKANLYQLTLSGVTAQVSRGDSSGKSGVTGDGPLTINRTIKNKENFIKIDDLAEARRERQHRLLQSQSVFDEMAKAKAKATPAPNCKHNKSLLSCITCCKELQESETA